MRIAGTARARAFTLVETLMASVAVGAIGVVIYITLLMGTILFNKNAAMNVSHEQARIALLQMEHDIHSAVSLPETVDTNFVQTTGTTPSAGICFQIITSGSGPCQVAANAVSSANQIKIYYPRSCPTPYAGERLIVPSYQIEQDITAVSTSGSTATLTLSGTLGAAVVVSQSGINYNLPCFLTQRVYYIVQPAGNAMVNGVSTPIYALNYYGPGVTRTYILSSSAIGSAQPFVTPTTSTGVPDYGTVVVNNLSIMNTSFADAITQFNSASIMLTGSIPIYKQLTTRQ